MQTKNVSTLKIHTLTKEQYERELANGNIQENELYLTPDDGSSEALGELEQRVDDLSSAVAYVDLNDNESAEDLEMDYIHDKMDNIIEQLAQKEQLSPEFAESKEWLDNNGDTSKLYVLPDGYIYAHTAIMTGGWTNQIPLSTDENGDIYNNVGYMEKYRITSEGIIKKINNKERLKIL